MAAVHTASSQRNRSEEITQLAGMPPRAISRHCQVSLEKSGLNMNCRARDFIKNNDKIWL